MIHARVVRVVAAVPAADINDDWFIQSLNQEFRIFGIKVTRRELKGAGSTLEISQAITRMID
jgi:hypothetical protein